MRTFHCVTLVVATGILVSAGTASAGSRLDVLHAFAINNPRTPYSALIQATDGNFYGTSPYGGAFYGGTVFKISPSGTLTVLHAFVGGIETFGVGPLASLMQASDGNFYGTTYSGGT